MSKYTGKYPELPTKTAKYAVQFAYPRGTDLKTYSYKKGKPKPEYKEALEEYFPKRSHWGKKSRKGASCDVFVGTVLRASGYSTAPRGLRVFKKFLKKHLKRVSKPKKNGDILFRNRHIQVYLSLKGNGCVANAHHNSHGGTYGIIESTHDYDYIFRSDKLSSLSKGDTFTSVIHLQRFLNWYDSSYGLKEDYVFGTKTEDAVKDFQTREGLEPTGHFGSKSLVAAKKVNK